jgi:hypothetical protein
MSSTIPGSSPRTNSQPRGPNPTHAAHRPTRTQDPSHVIALILGCLLLVPGVSLLFGGGGLAAVYGVSRASDGYIQTSPTKLNTTTAALTVEDLVVINDVKSPPWLVDALNADIRLTVTPATNRPVFAGIGPAADVNAYLAGTAHEQIVRLSDGGTPATSTSPGTATAPPPTEQGIWTAQATGVGAQELAWTVTDGSAAVVVMNADGSPGVAVTATAGLRAAIVLPLALSLLGIGLLITAGAVALIIWASRRRRGAQDTAPTSPTVYDTGQAKVPAAGPAHPFTANPFAADPFTAGYPVALTAHLDPQLSRWQWLVKWFLAIPHLLVLAVLWPVFGVLTVVAGIAILFTRTYPRGLFDINLGILRYSWRVSYYATNGGIGTDRYPPFTGGPVPGYPATLDIAYPGRLSRGLVLVKWWLLAIPHYLIVGLLIGSSWSQATLGDRQFGFDSIAGNLTSGGILGILVLVAGVMLLVTGAYPPALFALIIGGNRWIYRVIAYAALMTDQYPPFRLDQGGSEPVHQPGQPTPPTLSTPPTSPTPPSGTSTNPSDVRTPELASHRAGS